MITNHPAKRTRKAVCIRCDRVHATDEVRAIQRFTSSPRFVVVGMPGSYAIREDAEIARCASQSTQETEGQS